MRIKARNRTKLIFLGTLLISFMLISIKPIDVHAFDPTAHRYIAQKALELFQKNHPNTELQAYSPTIFNQSVRCNQT
jgi:hypothetical protein